MDSRAVNMLETLRMVREKFGSAEGYVIQKCGLTMAEVEKIRKNLVVEKPAVYNKPSEKDL
jgi:hypothetical protein